MSTCSRSEIKYSHAMHEKINDAITSVLVLEAGMEGTDYR